MSSELPVPIVNADSAPYWEGARRDQLLLQQCTDCQTFRFFPRYLCTHCGSEKRVLVGDRGAYRMTRAPEAWQIPVTAQAILAARIDRLPPEDKRLLQAASVIGKDIPFTLLQAIADVPENSLRRGLAHLQVAEFLYETKLFPALEYTFKHALTHEVAYASLLLNRRRALHARIVEAIEALYPDRLAEQIERLAHHAF
jgi:predicted ATPase